MLRRIPSSKSTRGSQPSTFRARVMSGRRTRGSSWGSGLWTMGTSRPHRRCTERANSRMVISCGLPMFTGSASPEWSSRHMPSTLSST